MKTAGIVIPPPPPLAADDDDDDEDEGAAATIKALSAIEHKCPICDSKLIIGKSKD